LRARDPSAPPFEPRKGSIGYTSPGHVEHFLPDREVNVARLNRALADVFGEPGLEEYWRQICADPWSGNVYKYNF
jgi:hypothetical protein